MATLSGNGLIEFKFYVIGCFWNKVSVPSDLGLQKMCFEK